jgi:hypothetical protein
MMAAMMPAGAMRRKRCAEHGNCLTWAHRARRLFPAPGTLSTQLMRKCLITLRIHTVTAQCSSGTWRAQVRAAVADDSALLVGVPELVGAQSSGRSLPTWERRPGIAVKAGPQPDNLAYRCPRGVTCKIR